MTLDESQLNAFLKELVVYAGPLWLALEKILDKKEAQYVIGRLDTLNAKGSYTTDLK